MSYPFIQARNHGGTQSTVRRFVVHGTVTPCARGWARRVANDFHTTTRDASAHYVIDPGEIIQCLTERTIGYHAPPNTGSLGFELCDPQKGSSARWRDANHAAMLRRAAALIRSRAKAWGIPLVKLSAADVRAGKKGICGHNDVSAAFHQTDHTDPGAGFPWAHFMDLVKGDDMPEPKELWTWDGIPAPPWIAEEGNKNWTPSSYLHWGYRNQAKLTEKVDTLSEKVDTLTAELAEIKALLAGQQQPGGTS
ncbi:MAG TPA: peptidoglycan recognition family protein [Streptosporangiaceae bacterium]|nr:peptidoglycan recognition family protein [Streptosporangiaceae bacterium]